jgi:hypothetical protein
LFGFGRDDGFSSILQRYAGPPAAWEGDLPTRGNPALVPFLAVLAGAQAFTDIARFGEKKLALLRRFRPFANGTPAHDHGWHRSLKLT